MRVRGALSWIAVSVVACVSDPATGGDSGVAPVACKASSDCPTGQFCSLYDIQTQKIFCQQAVAAGADIGQPCKMNADCKSNACAPTGTCSAACMVDTDCGIAAHCAQLKNGTWTIGACLTSCSNDASCPMGLVCFLLPNGPGTLWTRACYPAHASGGAAGTEKGTNGCYTDLTTSFASKTYCGKLCAGASDCTGVGPFTKCSQATITNPNGSGSTTVDSCGP